MVRDLNIPVKIKVLPTIRERDGLAMSSRNSYLSPQKRKDALIAYESLNLAKDLIKSGIRDTAKIISRMERLIKKKKDSAKIDYISIVDLENLKPLKRIFGNCLIVLAIFIGKTRLIDNFILRGPEARRTNT
jgi:pantoate--beta-alanine ligase